MMRVDEIVEQIGDLQRNDLDAWIREALISPQEDGGDLVFSEMECARIRLICTLRYDLGVEADTLPIIVSLLDQLHQSRQRLFKLSAAVAIQDKLVQTAILKAVERQTKTDEEE